MPTSDSSPTAGETAGTGATGVGVVSPPATTTKAKPEAVDDKPTHRVKYDGPTVHTRVISGNDFATMGASYDGSDLVWDLSNKHTLLLKLDDAQVEFFKEQPDFTVKALAKSDES